MGQNRATTSEARQRILETADRLFYQEGFRVVGVDRIVVEAEVAKATLYTHYRSKDHLILAVLEHRERCTTEFFRSAMERHGRGTRGPLLAFFAALTEGVVRIAGFPGLCFPERRGRTGRPGPPWDRVRPRIQATLR
jgi:AcrR family transcriptional regulator